MPDSGSMKSVSQSYTQHARSGPSDAGSRAACDAIQGVAPAITATTEREVEVRIEYSSEVDDEVLKEKSMHLPMRCNYWEATDRLPTLAPKKTQATQSSWGSDDVGEEKKVTFAEVEPQGHGKKSAASAVNLPTQKNHTHSSYASLPQAQSVGLSAEGNEFEIWDDTMGVAAEASKRSEGKHPTQSESCNLNLKSEKPKCSCGRITSLCARHRRACCCCGVSLGSFALFEVMLSKIPLIISGLFSCLKYTWNKLQYLEIWESMCNLSIPCPHSRISLHHHGYLLGTVLATGPNLESNEASSQCFLAEIGNDESTFIKRSLHAIIQQAHAGMFQSFHMFPGLSGVLNEYQYQ